MMLIRATEIGSRKMSFAIYSSEFLEQVFLLSLLANSTRAVLLAHHSHLRDECFNWLHRHLMRRTHRRAHSQNQGDQFQQGLSSPILSSQNGSRVIHFPESLSTSSE